MKEKVKETPFTAGNQWRFSAANKGRPATMKKLVKEIDEVFLMSRDDIKEHIVSNERKSAVVNEIAKLIIDGFLVEATMAYKNIKEAMSYDGRAKT